MKRLLVLVLVVFFSTLLEAQKVDIHHNKKTTLSDTIVPGSGTRKTQIRKIKEKKIEHLSDSNNNEPLKSALVDTTIQNKYGDLLNDDTVYNKKNPIWIPMLETFGAVALTWSFDRYVLNASYARIGYATWKDNVQNGWEWDSDKFGINFIGHPYSGTLSFNAGRSNGYNFLESAAFSVGGSLMWESFGENTKPSYNDIICTPVNGVFLGEVLYRLSSNILDDRTRGMERVSREILAGIIDPMRGLNRLILGQAFRVTNKEIYQKEPLNITLYAGLLKMNTEPQNTFFSGTNAYVADLQLDYGNPFEKRSRKPYDFFRLRAEITTGAGPKFLAHITGYGLLTGKNISFGNNSFLYGVFQYYDYWDNKTFELGNIAFGGGVFYKLKINKSVELYANAHLALIPFAGNSMHFGPDTSSVREYYFGDGIEGKFEMTLNLGQYATASVIYNYFFINTYVGLPGNNFISIIKPRLTVQVFKGISLGFEQYLYYNDRYMKDYPAVHTLKTEQKIIVLIYFEDDQRRGHYN